MMQFINNLRHVFIFQADKDLQVALKSTSTPCCHMHSLNYHFTPYNGRVVEAQKLPKLLHINFT